MRTPPALPLTRLRSSVDLARLFLPQEFEAAGYAVYGMSFDKPKSQVRWAVASAQCGHV